MREPSQQRYQRYERAIRGERLPLALVDAEAFDRNVDLVARILAPRQKKLRVASKSVRCPALLARIASRLGDAFSGLMTYTAEETVFLADKGYTDLLLAYPTARKRDGELLAGLNKRGAVASVVVDDKEQLLALEAGAREVGATLPVVVEVDMSYRAAGGRVHLGVRRSPLHDVASVVAFAELIREFPRLSFHGIMGYEAQIAGLADTNPKDALMNTPKRLVKRLSRTDVEKTRSALAVALRERGLAPKLFNGGGSGSLTWCVNEASLTEVTAGSIFLTSHLFDHYRDIRPEPAAYFALQVVRRPAAGMVTCHGGGYAASGPAGIDRLPIPALPEGLALLALEGAGEVQTPLTVAPGTSLALGDPVFFRHAKAGELAEHFAEYLLISDERIAERAPTYRGLGQTFL